MQEVKRMNTKTELDLYKKKQRLNMFDRYSRTSLCEHFCFVNNLLM